MSKRNQKWQEEENLSDLLSDEDKEKASRIEQTPNDQLPYEIMPAQQGGMGPAPEFVFKLIVIGDSAIGKSCLMHRMCHNEFLDDHEVTVGVEFGSLLIKMENIVFKLQIWDTAGQESFQSITKIFYRGAHAVFLTYDITQMDTFNHLKMWLREVQNEASNNALIFLVGNKKDKEVDREVDISKADQFMD